MVPICFLVDNKVAAYFDGTRAHPPFIRPFFTYYAELAWNGKQTGLSSGKIGNANIDESDATR